MNTTTLTAFEFIASSLKRRESWKTTVVVAGVKLLVIIFDVCRKGIHEVYVVIQETEKLKSVLHIPEIYIQRQGVLVDELVGSAVESFL